MHDDVPDAKSQSDALLGQLAEMKEMKQHLEAATAMINRELAHLRRNRLFIAWGALALAAASGAALGVAESVQTTVFSVMQLTLWSFIACLNFGGPKVSEWLARQRKS